MYKSMSVTVFQHEQQYCDGWNYVILLPKNWAVMWSVHADLDIFMVAMAVLLGILPFHKSELCKICRNLHAFSCFVHFNSQCIQLQHIIGSP
jgi:hypothetical protein